MPSNDPMEFHYFKCINTLFSIIEDILDLDPSHVFYSGNANDIPDYPYIAMNIPNPHHALQHNSDFTDQVFTALINCNLYNAKDPEWPITAVSALKMELRDPVYRQKLIACGATIDGVANPSSATSDIANANDIYVANMQIHLMFHVYYHSSIPRIKFTN